MNLWYINHYASPPGCGRGERPLHIAKGFSSACHTPLVIAASHHHLQFSEESSLTALTAGNTGGINFRLIESRQHAKKNGVTRLLGMRDFGRGIGQIERDVRKGELAAPDVIIYSSPHPFGYPNAQRLARKFNAKIIFEERDLWPLSLIELAGLHRWHPLVLWMDKIVQKAYREADAIVSLLPLADGYMQKLGMPSEHFNYIPNGISVTDWNRAGDNLPQHHQSIFDKCRDQQKFIVLYAGAMGKPNALDQLCSQDTPTDLPYHFILIGDGAERSNLEAAALNVGHVTVLPAVSKSEVRCAMDQADACFIALQDSPLFRYGVSPNKLFDYFMAAKPVVSAINAGNNPVQEACAGVSVEPYCFDALDSALRELMGLTTSARKIMGLNGRKYVLENHNWELLGKRYAGLCERLLSTPRTFTPN